MNQFAERISSDPYVAWMAKGPHDTIDRHKMLLDVSREFTLKEIGRVFRLSEIGSMFGLDVIGKVFTIGKLTEVFTTDLLLLEFGRSGINLVFRTEQEAVYINERSNA